MMSGTATASKIETFERRSFNRVTVDLLGRFMREDRSEHSCRAENMSPGDAAILSDISPHPDERIIVYFDHIGRLEGKVLRTYPGGFVLIWRVGERKREKLAAQLTWFANRHELDLPEDRRHERIAPTTQQVEMTLGDGRRYKVDIIDLSLSGAAVRSTVRPALGSPILLGTTKGRVVRHLDEGFAVEFAAIKPDSALV